MSLKLKLCPKRDSNISSIAGHESCRLAGHSLKRESSNYVVVEPSRTAHRDRAKLNYRLVSMLKETPTRKSRKIEIVAAAMSRTTRAERAHARVGKYSKQKMLI